MTMEWHETLGFDGNPFSLDTLNSDFRFIGREKEGKELLYRIDSGSMLLIGGEKGSGKTAMLKYAIDNFKGKGKVIYVDARKVSRRLNVSELVRKKPKGMILLMDNVQAISERNNERIKFYYDQDRIKSVVFTTDDIAAVNFSGAIKDRVGSNIIKLKNLSQSDALGIARDRLGDNEILPDEVLKEIYKTTSSIKEFLLKCDLMCAYTVKKGKEKAEVEDIGKLPRKVINEEDETNICYECNEKLVKAGENWRCKNCDQFCTGCGALVDEEDASCPECGAKFEG